MFKGGRAYNLQGGGGGTIGGGGVGWGRLLSGSLGYVNFITCHYYNRQPGKHCVSSKHDSLMFLMTSRCFIFFVRFFLSVRAIILQKGTIPVFPYSDKLVQNGIYFNCSFKSLLIG